VADFVIGEFSLLGPLVLYYGREWNRRNSKLVNYNFFKNSYHVLAIFGFGAVSFFSGTILFEMVMYQFFNSFFTAVPIVIWALADDEYSWEESLLIPKVYLRGLNGHYFNTKTFWKNMALGAFCGVFSIWLVEFSMEPGVVDSYGRVSYRS
jgi:phospholipid-transporting ATPase